MAKHSSSTAALLDNPAQKPQMISEVLSWRMKNQKVKWIKTEIVESTGNADNENHVPNTFVNCSSIAVINYNFSDASI